MSRRLCAAFIVSVAVASLPVLASSAFADSTCPTGYACVWKDPGYGGEKKLIPASESGQGTMNLGPNFNNQISSFKNRFTNKYFRMSVDQNGGGLYSINGPNSDCANMAFCSGLGDNTVSSYEVFPTS